LTVFGKSELFTTAQLRDVGVNMVIFPVSLLRLAMGVSARALETIKAEGGLASMLDQMQHRADLYDLLDYESYGEYDSTIFNFHVPG
jgi:methylisocitrate lyase